MNHYIENRQIDPFYNLALEQILVERADPGNSYFMLWQNNNAVIIGKHQNTNEEINAEYVRENGIAVARRLSGGGAVYHDLGNLNFTFIVTADNRESLNFSFFCRPICEALRSLGVPVQISGRNDMTVDGKKISGNAQYIRNNRIMHHGTILYDSNLDILSNVLKPKDKAESRSVKSVKSAVANIRPHMQNDTDVSGFWNELKIFLILSLDMRETDLNPEFHEAALELKEKKYSQWEWNYGSSPPHTMRKTRRFEGCGKIDILLDVGSDGILKNIVFYGDFFGNRDPAELGIILAGHHLEYRELKAALSAVEVSRYFHGLDNEAFLALLLE